MEISYHTCKNVNFPVEYFFHLHIIFAFVLFFFHSLHVKLYASEVTCAFLSAAPKYKFLEPYLKSLPIEQPINITIPDDISNKVSLSKRPEFV